MIRSLLLLVVVSGLFACGDPAEESRAGSIAAGEAVVPVGADDEDSSAAQRLLLLLLGGCAEDDTAQVFAGVSATTRMSSPDPMPGRQRDDDDGGMDNKGTAGTNRYR